MVPRPRTGQREEIRMSIDRLLTPIRERAKPKARTAEYLNRFPADLVNERDQFIDKRAALAGSAAALIALAAASVIPQFIVGQTGSVPAWLLPIINFGVVIIGLIVYFAANLILYGRGR